MQENSKEMLMKQSLPHRDVAIMIGSNTRALDNVKLYMMFHGEETGVRITDVLAIQDHNLTTGMLEKKPVIRVEDDSGNKYALSDEDNELFMYMPTPKSMEEVDPSEVFDCIVEDRLDEVPKDLYMIQYMNFVRVVYSRCYSNAENYSSDIPLMMIPVDYANRHPSLVDAEIRVKPHNRLYRKVKVDHSGITHEEIIERIFDSVCVVLEETAAYTNGGKDMFVSAPLAIVAIDTMTEHLSVKRAILMALEEKYEAFDSWSNAVKKYDEVLFNRYQLPEKEVISCLT